MKIKKEGILIYLIIFFSLIFSLFVWDNINLKFIDPEVIGIYSENNYHSFNDILRYLLFILLPSLSYLISKLYFDKNFFLKIKLYLLNGEKNDDNQYHHKISFIIFFTIIIVFLLNFFSIEFPNHKIDTYHDGQRLSSAYQSYIDNSLWSKSFVTVGIFYETLSSKFIWQIFDHISIGLARYSEIIYILLLKILLVCVIYNLLHFVKLNSFYRNIFFLINALVANQLTDYNLSTVDLITFREIPIVILALLFILMLRFSNNKIYLLIISTMSVFSMLWGIDRGLVCNILILIILTYFFLKKDYRNFLFLISSILVSWSIFFIYDRNEFFYFFENTLLIYNYMNYIHGIIHPIPFSDDPNSGRATKTIMLILLCLMISLKIIFKKETLFNNNLKKSLLFLSFICVLSYIYALGRSDGSHIKHTFGFPLLTIGLFFSYYLCFLLERKNIKTLNICSLLIIIPFVFFSVSINIKNLNNFEKRFNNFIYQSDDFFLSDEEKKFINQAKLIANQYECIQLFSNDAAFNYLLRKKSCTKYYFVWSATPNKVQQKLINELGSAKLIIKGGEKSNWELPLEKKLNLVNKYIDQNYKKKISISQWQIFLRNNS